MSEVCVLTMGCRMSLASLIRAKQGKPCCLKYLRCSSSVIIPTTLRLVHVFLALYPPYLLLQFIYCFKYKLVVTADFAEYTLHLLQQDLDLEF